MQDTQIIIDLLVKRAEESARQLDSVTAAVKRLEASSKGLESTNKTTAASSDKNAASQGNLAKTTDSVAGATDRASKSQKSFVGHIAKTTVLSAGVNQLFLQMIDVTGQAIQNVDLMNNFPATMASMGQSTERANVAFQALRDYVGQIGGNLGDATSYVTRFTGATGDVKAATAIFVGLNNALIAGDSSLEEQRGAMLQFAQALERGKIEAKEWNILTQNMSFQLNQVAQSMGYVSSASLREAMVAGKVSMAEFTVALTKMSTGTGDIVTQAEARMNGMQFAFNRMKNTMVQGLASVIDAIGRQNIVSFFSFMTQVIQVLTSVVLKLISALITLFNFFGKLFGLPAIKLKKDVEGVASGLGDGAGNAGDLKDGLDDAGDSAKKLNKSLASFDKMNVLPDKESGGGGKAKDAGGAGGAGFDAGQLGELGDLFDGIGGGLEEASKWAKIFAGVLVGLAGIKFAQAILGELAKMSQGFQAATKTVDKLKDAIKNSGSSKDAFKGGQQVGADFKNGMADNFRGISGAIGGIIGGLAATVGPAISGVITAGAAALGVSIGVFVAIIAAAIAVIIAVILTIRDNWDTIVNAMKKVWEVFTDVLKKLWEPAIEALNKAWDKFYEVIRPGVEKVQELFKKLGEFLAPIWKKITDAVKPFTDKIAELYQKYIQPLIDKFKEWAAESGSLMAVLKVLGIIITVIVLAPLALVVIAIGLVVATVVALAAAIIWVISKFIEFATYIIGGGLWEDIQALVSATGQWIQDKFNEAVEFVKSIFSTIAEWFKVNVWDRIMAIFSVVGTWFKDRFNEAVEGIKIIWNVVADYFKNVWEGIKLIFSVVVEFYRGIFQGAWDIIMSIWNTVGNWFGNIWNNIKNVFSVVGEFFGGVFQGAWDKITSIFSGLWNWFKTNVWDRITGVFSNIGSSIGDAVSGAFKGVVNTAIGFVANMINTVIRAINGAIGVINKIPGVNIGKVGEVSLPRLARGGIIDQPTAAILGEDGREAVVPLENNLEWIDKLAAKINASTGGSGQPIQLTVQIGEDKIASQIIDLINEKTQMSGRNMIYV